MTIDMRLVTKGRGEPMEGLLQQGKVHVTLAKQYAAALIESGWSDEDTSALELELARLEAMGAGEGGASGEDEPNAIVEAKAFVRRLRNALPRALRETKAEGVNEAVFDAGGKLGREASKIAAYLEKIRPSVAALDGELRRHFGGKSASELLDQVKSAVERVGQGSTTGEVPQDKAELFAAKGRVLEMIEDLNRAGRIAFEGQAETVGKFNKDLLLRARRSRGSAKGEGGAASQAS
jgi:hypothetical protein